MKAFINKISHVILEKRNNVDFIISFELTEEIESKLLKKGMSHYDINVFLEAIKIRFLLARIKSRSIDAVDLIQAINNSKLLNT